VYTVVYWPVEAVKRDVYTGYRSDLKGKSRTREENSTGNIWVGISEFSAIRIFVQNHRKSLTTICLEAILSEGFHRTSRISPGTGAGELKSACTPDFFHSEDRCFSSNSKSNPRIIGCFLANLTLRLLDDAILFCRMGRRSPFCIVFYLPVWLR
jgi:hypothetical protein